MRAACAVLSAVVVMLASSGVRAQTPRAGGERLGKGHFATSCAPAAAEEVDHAIALPHPFEFADAIAGFKKVLDSDPACGIAQWGIAMATWGNPFAGLRAPKVLQDGLVAAEKAQSIGAKTDRERAYIAAVALLYKDAAALDHRARTLAYEKAMALLSAKYPDDREAAAFYALAVDQTAPPTDKTYANQLKAAAILERLYKVEPDHPGVTHYLIHSYDVPALAPRALPYARKYANLARGWAASAIPARWAVERGAWADAAALPVHPAGQPFIEAITRFARAIGAARSGKPDAAGAEVDELKALQEKEVQAKDAYWATQLDIQRQAADALRLWAAGKKEEAVRALSAAAALEDTTDQPAITPGPIAPAHELLGEMLLDANQAAAALKEFEASLKKEPNRFRSVYGAGRAAEAAGDRAKARTYYAPRRKIRRGDRGDRRAAVQERAVSRAVARRRRLHAVADALPHRRARRRHAHDVEPASDVLRAEPHRRRHRRRARHAGVHEPRRTGRHDDRPGRSAGARGDRQPIAAARRAGGALDRLPAAAVAARATTAGDPPRRRVTLT